MKTALLGAWLLLSSGCAFNFDLVGGPRHEVLSLRTNELDTQLEQRVHESPSAMATLQSVRTRKRVGTVLTWVGIGSLAPCLAVSYFSTKGASGLAPIIATCGASIALNLVSLFVNPWPSAWGTVLLAHNEDFPATPWSSRFLGVPPPAPAPLSLASTAETHP